MQTNSQPRGDSNKGRYFKQRADAFRTQLADVQRRLSNIRRNTEGWDLTLPNNRSIVRDINHLEAEEKRLGKEISNAMFHVGK